MPQIITCPDCARELRVPEDLLGKQVRCPGCSVMFKAVAGGGEEVEDPIEEPDEEPAPRRKATDRDDRYSDSPRSSRRLAEDDRRDAGPSRRRRDEDDDDYEERGPSPRDKKAGWNKVRIGINLVMIGTWVWLAGLVLGGLGGLLGIVLLGGALTSGSSQTGLASLGFAGILLLLSVGVYYLCLFAELVLRLVGYGLCMAVPPRRDTGLRPLAITSFSLASAHVLFSILNIVVSGFTGFASSFRSRSGIDAAGGGVSLLARCADWRRSLSFYSFCAACATMLAHALAGSPITVLITFISYYVVAVLIVAVMICAGVGTAGVAMQSQSASSAANSMGAWVIIFLIMVFILGLVYVALHVWYVMVLQKIRDAVASYRRGL